MSERVKDLLVKIEALCAEGRVLSNVNLGDLKKAITVLQNIVQRAEKDMTLLQAGRIILSDDGVSFELDGTPEPVLSIEEDGLELKAGERFGTMCLRKRRALGLTSAEVSDTLPIGVRSYEAIEQGYSGKLADDILTALCATLGLNKAEAVRLSELDSDQPTSPRPY
jgi:hypothetical protein